MAGGEGRAAPEETVLTPERRSALFYLLLFTGSGVATTFAGLWFHDRGLTEQQIGIINSAPVFSVLLFNLIVGRIADRASDWRQVIIAGAMISAVLSFGLFAATGFVSILVFWTLAQFSTMVIVPVADAAVMRMARRRGSDYSGIRAWATVGYLLAILGTGALAGGYGAGVFLPLMAGFAVLRAAVSLGLPRFRSPHGQSGPSGGARSLSHLMRPWFLLPIVGWAMVFGSHVILNAFQALLWSRQGIDVTTISVLIAIGAMAEAAMFFVFRRFAGRVSARYMMLLSAVVTALRLAAMALTPPVPVLAAMQLLHSVTYALGFLGSVNFVTNWTSEEIAAEAQGFMAMVHQIFAVLAMTAFGWLAARWGAHAYFASATLAATGGALVWVSIRLRQPTTK